MDSLLYTLLRRGLGHEDALAEPFRLEAECCNKVYAISREQAIHGIVADAMAGLDEGAGVPPELVLRLVRDTMLIKRRSEKMLHIVSETMACLKAGGLNPIVMKGPSVAAYYPKPELRVSGDIDIYLRPSEFSSGVEFLLSFFRSPYEKESDGAFLFKFKGESIELHSRYFDIYKKNSQLPLVPSPEAELLMLSLHILKHALGSGVGLRQICDFAMAANSLKGSFDSGRLIEYFKATGSLRWNRMLSALIYERLGIDTGIFPLPEIHSAHNAKPVYAPLERIIFEGGNFGHYSSGRAGTLLRGGSSRKSDTARRIARKAFFAARVAPGVYLDYVYTLIKGNF